MSWLNDSLSQNTDTVAVERVRNELYTKYSWP